MNQIAIICPTYKESFILRKALMDLNIKWADDRNLIGLHWKEIWNVHKDNTVYYIDNNRLQYGYLPNLTLYNKSYNSYSVNEFIKEYLL